MLEHVFAKFSMHTNELDDQGDIIMCDTWINKTFSALTASNKDKSADHILNKSMTLATLVTWQPLTSTRT